MATALSLEQFLSQSGTAYDEMRHAPTVTAIRSAQVSHVPAACLAKAVVLKTGGGYMVAVLPASRHLAIGRLRDRLDQDVSLASEEEIGELFHDCAPGAVPPVGAAYGLTTIVDEAIDSAPEVWFEAGDHKTLVHMSAGDFGRLMAEAPHAPISTPG